MVMRLSDFRSVVHCLLGGPEQQLRPGIEAVPHSPADNRDDAVIGPHAAGDADNCRRSGRPGQPDQHRIGRSHSMVLSSPGFGRPTIQHLQQTNNPASPREAISGIGSQ
jgi:hypothetical protein